MGCHSFSRGLSQPRNWTWISCIAGQFFTVWATREAYVINKAQRYKMNPVEFGISISSWCDLQYPEKWQLSNWQEVINIDSGESIIVSAFKLTYFLFYVFQDWSKTSGAKGKAGKRSYWLCYWCNWITAWYGRWWSGPQLCQSEPLPGTMYISKRLQVSISPSGWTTGLPSRWPSTVSRQRPLRKSLCQGQQAIPSTSTSWQVI